MAAEPGYDALIYEVCVVWGFCGSTKDDIPLHVDLFIPPSGPVTADQFVEWVFLADNHNPNLKTERSQGIKSGIREAFIRHLGAEVVDASQLRYSFESADDRRHPEAGSCPAASRSRASASSCPISGSSTAISGPLSRPVSAWRSGWNRALPLRSALSL